MFVVSLSVEFSLTWYHNACFELRHGQTRILFDPWLEGAANYGSWFPKKTFTPELREKIYQTNYSAIVVSHHHTDHFDHLAINKFLTFNQKTKLYFPKATEWILADPIKVLKRRFGENRIKILEDGDEIKVGKIAIKSFRADFCDPGMCGNLLGCLNPSYRTRSIDSFFVINILGFKILNLNDCLVEPLMSNIRKVIDQVDLVMGLYGSAGPYPQCFPQIRQDPGIQNSVAHRYVDSIAKMGQLLRSRFIFPFSGQYQLAGSLAYLEQYKGVIPFDTAKKRIEKSAECEVLDILPGQEVIIQQEGKSFTSLYQSGNFECTNQEFLLEYERALSEQVFPYQLRSEESLSESLLKECLVESNKRYSKCIIESGAATDHTIILDPKQLDWVFAINSKRDSLSGFFPKNLLLEKNFTRVELDARLLNDTIFRKRGYVGFARSHWMNIQGGSHLTFYQQNYSPTALYFMNFFHT